MIEVAKFDKSVISDLFCSSIFTNSNYNASKFYLKKAQRGKGYSKKMLQFVIEQAKDYGKQNALV